MAPPPENFISFAEVYGDPRRVRTWPLSTAPLVAYVKQKMPGLDYRKYHIVASATLDGWLIVRTAP